MYDTLHSPVRNLCLRVPLQDVCLAVLFVSCKVHDTLKKTRDILMASYGVRFPERAAKAKAMGGEIDIDPNVCPFRLILCSWGEYVTSRRWSMTGKDC